VFRNRVYLLGDGHGARGCDKVMWSNSGIVFIVVHNDVHRLGEAPTSLVRGALFMYSVELGVALSTVDLSLIVSRMPSSLSCSYRVRWRDRVYG